MKIKPQAGLVEDELRVGNVLSVQSQECHYCLSSGTILMYMTPMGWMPC